MADPAKSRTFLESSSRNLLLLVLLAANCGAGGMPQQSQGDLTEASLETLMNLEVSSPGRKEQKLSQTAGAVYVITQEDIRRSGLSSIPELLRMVPGLQVARIDANSWSVTARGFAGRFADKMLVLIDGRSIYSHMFSGVYWEQNTVPLDDIERIEVIRGPGATMWGANAVNGVINIITKPASETQGLMVSAGGGNEERASATVRYGGRAGDHISYRADADYFQEGPFSTATGQAAHDRWDLAQGGGRADWQKSERDTFTFEGNIYRSDAQQTIYPNYPMNSLSPGASNSLALSGEYGLGRWVHKFSDRSDFAMQFSVSDEDRLEGFGQLDELTTEFDFQHHFALSSRHDLMWGFGFEVYRDETSARQIFPAPSSDVRFVPAAGTEALGSFFAQDQIALWPEHLTLTLGAKIEDTDPFGIDIQPSARLLWKATQRQDLWAAVSRAVTTPSLVDRDSLIEFQATQAAGIIGILSGNPAIQPEQALSYEAGYRHQPARWVTFDLATFFSIYHDLRTIDLGAPYLESGPPPALVVPLYFGNKSAGHTYGMEIATNWSVTQKWRLTANYSWFRFGLNSGRLGAQDIQLDIEGSSPAHQVQFRSQWDLGRKFTLDGAVYFVSALTGLSVPAYVRTDARLGWRLSRAAEVSLAGQNLLDGRHYEFATTDYVQCTEIGRAVQLRVTWAF
jgi:iron complex outermembrane receptor protein